VNLVRLLLALLAAVTLAITASALQEKVTTGPYSVSFDMNATLNYTVESLDPVEEDDRTEYQLTINANDSTKAKIFIAEYKDLVDSTEEMWQTVNRQHLESIGLNNITLASEMVIDGMPAFGLVGKDIANTTLYSAYYWLDSNTCECGPVSVGKTVVAIMSVLPLNITGQFMDTLHIEKNTEASGPLTFAPPKV
jgi:hypothetical protein